jgi:ferredoxin-NADP reductase
MAGQHFVVRLTAPDGYRAQRSYSVASPPSDEAMIELTVERLDGGEVSTFLHDEVGVGDTLEVRGPIGGWFVWSGTTPALLIGGGSGVAPLMSMLRLARGTARASLAHLVVSVRSPRELIYADEMIGSDVTVIYTRSTITAAMRAAGRLTIDDLGPLLRDDATVYVCGSARFVQSITSTLTGGGVAAERIRIEQFGPTG